MRALELWDLHILQCKTDHACLTWLLSFKEPEGQLARWIEALQRYDFEIQHQAGRLYTNADALSRRPCEVVDCRHCQHQEEQEQTIHPVAAMQPAGVREQWLMAVRHRTVIPSL